MIDYKNTIEEILSRTGIKINGEQPWDIKVHNEALYKRILSQGTLGLGESYMDGWWDCDALDEACCRISQINDNFRASKAVFFDLLSSRIFNIQSKKQSMSSGAAHYDKGNDLYKNMLDKRMTYTCAYWDGAKNLDEAQETKMDLICQKLGFSPGDKVLDIGCGWGSFLKYAAEKYNIEGVGVATSKEQLELGKKMCKGLPIELRLQDYRDINGKFNYIVSIGMLEAVGYKNYRTFMEAVNRSLEDEGLFLLHTIGTNISTTSTDPWINKYIFPGGMLPSIKQLGDSIENLFVMEDWHNFGADYDKTLMAWHNNFEKNWGRIKKNYDERFFRMWKYYLLTCAGAFRSRDMQLWQIVLSKRGISGGHRSVR